MIIGNSVSDSNFIGDTYGYIDTTGRTVVSPHLVSGERLGVFIVVGQSNSANFSNNLYTATNPKSHNLNVYTGEMFRAKDPMMGAHYTGGGFTSRLPDLLIAAGKYDRVIMVPAGVGGTTIASWAPNAVLHPHILVAIRRCRALNLPITAILWHQGETDADGGMSQSTYQTHLTNIIASTRTEGFTGPWMVARVSFPSLTGTAVRAAQNYVIANVANVKAGPDTDLIGAGYRHDGTHFGLVGSNDGTLLHADGWKTNIITLL